MNSADSDAFQQAIHLFETGQIETAYQLFRAILKNNSRNPHLLLWISYTTRELEEAEKALQKAAMLMGSHPDLEAARQKLTQRAPFLKAMGRSNFLGTIGGAIGLIAGIFGAFWYIDMVGVSIAPEFVNRTFLGGLLTAVVSLVGLLASQKIFNMPICCGWLQIISGGLGLLICVFLIRSIEFYLSNILLIVAGIIALRSRNYSVKQ